MHNDPHSVVLTPKDVPSQHNTNHRKRQRTWEYDQNDAFTECTGDFPQVEYLS